MKHLHKTLSAVTGRFVWQMGVGKPFEKGNNAPITPASFQEKMKKKHAIANEFGDKDLFAIVNREPLINKLPGVKAKVKVISKILTPVVGALTTATLNEDVNGERANRRENLQNCTKEIYALAVDMAKEDMKDSHNWFDTEDRPWIEQRAATYTSKLLFAYKHQR